LVTASRSGCVADEVVVGGFAASPRRLFRLDSGEDDAPRGSGLEEELLSPSASPSGFRAPCSFVTQGAETDDWDALGVVHHEAIVWNDTSNATDTESEKSGSSSSGWNPSSDATASSGWTERETFSERSSSSRDEQEETFPVRSALFSPLPRACSRAFREAVEAVEREDERRTREAERFVAERLVKKDERDGSRAKLADAENVDPETVARSSHPATARAAAAAAADAAATREKNAAAFAALRRSLELNSPRAPPPVRTRVAPRETKKKKPLASRSSVSVPATKVPRPSSSSRDAKRRRDEKRKEKTSWEPEKTWPPLPAAEPDETAVAEEEAEAPTAIGGVAKLEDEKDATKTNDAKQKQTHECVSAASSSSVWAAIVAADSDKTKTTEVFEFVADTRNDYDASPIESAEKTTLSKEVFEETAPAVFAFDAREGAKSPLRKKDDDAEATRRRCEAAVAALEDAVRLALDARAAAAACAPNAAAEMDKKMADAARSFERQDARDKWPVRLFSVGAFLFFRRRGVFRAGLLCFRFGRYRKVTRPARVPLAVGARFVVRARLRG
jgi:hypothetical protein